MNTIKIYLAEDGSTASLQKDFDLYQYEYQNKLLNVYVPTSICAGPFVDDDLTTGYSCQIKMTAHNTSNVEKITGSFYMRYVKTLTYNGVEYALFERLLPYAFTIYSGVSGNAPQLSISVVNIVIENNTPEIISITNTQTCAIDVNPSTQVQSEEPDDPSDLDTLEALYTTISNNMLLKQNIALDPATITAIEAVLLSGIAPTQVEESLIDLFTQTQTNVSNISTISGDLQDAQQDILDLQNSLASGVRIIGTMQTTDSLPTQQQLNDFRSQYYSDTSNGDIIWIQETITGGTDKFWIATYSVNNTTWTITEIQFLENASNTDKGIVQGNVNDTSDTSKILFDIQSGKIVDAKVYYNATWVSIKTYLDALNTQLTNILNGTTAVPKATGDAGGNNIQGTYLTKSLGATKEYVQNYSAPRAVNDLYYFNFTDMTLDSELVNNASPLSTSITQIGQTSIGDFAMTLPQDILLGAKNGMMFSGYFQPSDTITGKIKAEIYYALADESYATEYLLGAQLTNETNFVSGSISLVEISTLFSQLNDELTLAENDKLIVKLYFVAESTYTATLDFIANDTYNGLAFIDRLAYVQYVISSNDYDQLTNKPIINIDLTSATLTDLPTFQLYRHIGLSTTTYEQGMLYFRNANESTMTPIWQEWVDSAQFSDGTAITRTNNTLVIPIVTPNLVPFVDLEDVVDATPTEDSDNLMTSGGIYTALGSKANLSIVAPAYDSTSTYAVGDIVIYEGVLYKCSTAVSTAEAFDSTKWTSKTIDEIVSENVPDMSAYMTKSNPTGTGALSLNRASGSTVGANSVAEGSNCTASGMYSHAEGQGTKAQSNYAHAEGIQSNAQGSYTHAEGGYTLSFGEGSHAEGQSTRAMGYYSHAQGRYTTAKTKSQHTMGEFNVLDTSGSLDTRGDFVEIVGNGTADNSRSNARALGWNGNEYLAGDLYVNCDSNSANGKKVATAPTIDTTSTSPITLTDNTSFRLGTISTLTINTASTYPLDFECEVVFTADSTIAIDYSALTLTWSGDDVASNVFTPTANKTYNILFFNNATAVATPSLQAIVRGV